MVLRLIKLQRVQAQHPGSGCTLAMLITRPLSLALAITVWRLIVATFTHHTLSKNVETRSGPVAGLSRPSNVSPCWLVVLQEPSQLKVHNRPYRPVSNADYRKGRLANLYVDEAGDADFVADDP